MIVLGVVLMVIAAVVAVGVLLDNAQPVALSFYGVGISNASVSAILVIGIVIAVMFVVGLWLTGSGARRGHRRRREFRRLKMTASGASGGQEEGIGAQRAAARPGEEADAERPDTGTPDTGTPDAERPDTGTPDAAAGVDETQPLENRGGRRTPPPT